MLSDWSDVPVNDAIETPQVAQLIGNYPNPFNPSTTISFSTAKNEPVQITIFNQKGQIVRTWDIDSKEDGIQHLVWDGRDQNGNPVTSGVYYYHMKSGKYSSSRKMVLMK
jgi:flagellar hook assembly protein FlgD